MYVEIPAETINVIYLALAIQSICLLFLLVRNYQLYKRMEKIELWNPTNHSEI